MMRWMMCNVHRRMTIISSLLLVATFMYTSLCSTTPQLCYVSVDAETSLSCYHVLFNDFK